MKLLHGTSSSNAAHIMKSGLKPRRGVGNWYKKHQFPTNKQFIFLTAAKEAYEFHALRTALIHNSNCTVLEAEVEEENLYPDENLFAVLEQAIIYDKEQLQQYQQKAIASKELWKDSLERAQAVAHRGPVEVDKLKVVSEYPIEKSIFYGFVQHHTKRDVDAFDASLHAVLRSQELGIWQDPKFLNFEWSALEVFPDESIETQFSFKYKGANVT
jgi:hypothetical protein